MPKFVGNPSKVTVLNQQQPACIIMSLSVSVVKEMSPDVTGFGLTGLILTVVNFSVLETVQVNEK